MAHVYENVDLSKQPLYVNTPPIQAADVHGPAGPRVSGGMAASSPAPGPARTLSAPESEYEVLRDVNLPAHIEPLPSDVRGRKDSRAGAPAPELMTIVITRGSARNYGITLAGGYNTAIGVTVVSTVSPESPAAGVILVGDIILDMNGINLAGKTNQEAQDIFLRFNSDARITFKIQRNKLGGDDTYMDVKPTFAAARSQSVSTAKLAEVRGGRAYSSPYVANVSREDADAILANKPNGSFVIRPSTTRPSEFVLAIKTGDSVEHVGPLGVPEGQLPELVERHRKILDGLPTLLKLCYSNPLKPF